MRRFELHRTEDVSGVSGIGHVADGVEWEDCSATIHWLGSRPSWVHWDSIDDAIEIHGHGGKTEFIYLDD